MTRDATAAMMRSTERCREISAWMWVAVPAYARCRRSMERRAATFFAQLIALRSADAGALCIWGALKCCRALACICYKSSRRCILRGTCDGMRPHVSPSQSGRRKWIWHLYRAQRNRQPTEHNKSYAREYISDIIHTHTLPRRLRLMFQDGTFVFARDLRKKNKSYISHTHAFLMCAPSV